MDPQKASSSTETASTTEIVWETLTVIQQETVLQTMVWVCRQLVEQWLQEVSDELVIA